jgi:hypothetical protein
MLRKTLLTKIRSMQQAIRLAELGGLTVEVQRMRAKIEEEWSEFGEVELLLNF